MNLTEAIQMQALEHLDMLAVSLDGARAETYERLWPGADFQRVTQQVAAFAPASALWEGKARKWSCFL